MIGIRRRSRTGKLLMGSNFQEILLNAECPVVPVKADYRPDSRQSDSDKLDPSACRFVAGPAGVDHV